MPDQIDQIVQHTRQYWFSDGINEMAFGGLSLLLGAYFGLQAWLPQNSALSQALIYGFMVFVIFSALLMRKLVNLLKHRITYPRTGYVAYQQPRRSRRLVNAAAALGLGALGSVLFASAPEAIAWIPAASGLMIGAVWLYVAFRTGLGRFYALGLFSALVGTAISLSGLSEDPGLAIYYGTFGAGMLISGCLALVAYLKNTRPIAAEDEEMPG